MSNGWRILAIIFMILFAIETVLFGLLIKIGLEEIDLEMECVINVCTNQSVYSWDTYEGICSCYSDEGILEKERFLS